MPAIRLRLARPLSGGPTLGDALVMPGMVWQALQAYWVSAWRPLSWQGFHVLVLVLMGLYVCARRWTGRLQPRARASLDNTALLWHYTMAQGLAAMGIVYLMPLLESF